MLYEHPAPQDGASWVDGRDARVVVIDPQRATELLELGVRIVRIHHAWTDDHELSLGVECALGESDARVWIGMEYCCAHDTEWDTLLVWALLRQHDALHAFFQPRLEQELRGHTRWDHREV